MIEWTNYSQYLVLSSIAFLYFVFALLLTPLIKKLIGMKVCAICAACSSTWLVLLLMKIYNICNVDTRFIAVLIGGSTVGIMYLVQSYFQQNKISKFYLVRILIIISGYLLAYSVAVWNKQQATIASILTLLTVIVTFLIIILSKKGNNNKVAKSKEETEKVEIDEDEKKKAIEKIEKSLDDCCS